MDDLVGESGSDWGWVIGEPTCLSAVNVGAGEKMTAGNLDPRKLTLPCKSTASLKFGKRPEKNWVISLGVQYLVGPILLGWHRVQMVYIHMLNDLSVVDRFYITDYRETGNGKPKLVKL